MKSNIVLIGMPGCGKSTCGVLAAKALCKAFTDTDLLIQEKEGRKLQDIINTEGNEYFAKTEEEVLCGVCLKNNIIATGGSAVYYERAMEHLKTDATVVYLKISFEEMTSRIKNMKTRGILLHNGETMEDMFLAREALYEKYADAVIDCNGRDVESTVAELCNIANMNYRGNDK